MTPILPEVAPFRQQSRHEDGWTDHYGALHQAFAYAGLPLPERYRVRGLWQHGCLGPWEAVTPGALVFNAPGARQRPTYVARQEEADFLRAHGYTHARAIGMPILYTPPSGVARVPGSLLVMPTHSMDGDRFPDREAFERYADEVAAHAKGFTHVTVCIHPSCERNGLWISEFAARGFTCVPGARTNDAHALRRMRALFEQYETVTTNGWGSHVAYALAFGARVAVTGTRPAFNKQNLLRDLTWAADVRSLELTLAEECQRQQGEFLREFAVPPAAAVGNQALGDWLVGRRHQLSPPALAELLRDLVVTAEPAAPGVCARPWLFVAPMPTKDGAADELLRFLIWLRRESAQQFAVLAEAGHPLRENFSKLATVHTVAELAAAPALLRGFAAICVGALAGGEWLDELPATGLPVVQRIGQTELGHTRLAPRHLVTALRRSVHCVVDGEGTGDRLRRVYRVAPDRISVCAPVATVDQAAEFWATLQQVTAQRPEPIAPEVSLAESYAGWLLAEVPERAYVEAHLRRAEARCQARDHLQAGRPREGLQTLLAALGRDLATKDGLIIVESLCEIGTDLARLDAKQSAALLGKAAGIARAAPWDLGPFQRTAAWLRGPAEARVAD